MHQSEFYKISDEETSIDDIKTTMVGIGGIGVFVGILVIVSFIFG